MYMRIIFLKVMVNLLRHALIWIMTKTFNDIKFRKEAKTIIFVDIRLDPLNTGIFIQRLVTKDFFFSETKYVLNRLS